MGGGGPRSSNSNARVVRIFRVCYARLKYLEQNLKNTSQINLDLFAGLEMLRNIRHQPSPSFAFSVILSLSLLSLL